MMFSTSRWQVSFSRTAFKGLLCFLQNAFSALKADKQEF
jgi:hypothetical protein